MASLDNLFDSPTRPAPPRAYDPSDRDGSSSPAPGPSRNPLFLSPGGTSAPGTPPGARPILADRQINGHDRQQSRPVGLFDDDPPPGGVMMDPLAFMSPEKEQGDGEPKRRRVVAKIDVDRSVGRCV